MKGPKHLWTGDWRAHRDEQPPQRPPLRELPPPPPEPEPPRSRRGLVLAGIGAAALVLLIVAFAAGALLQEEKPAPKPRAKAPAPKSPIGAIYAKASPAVVSIRTRNATGTGWLYDRDGTLVTNAHVVGRSREVSVRFGAHTRSIFATVLGTDPSTDLAVLKIAVSDTPNVDPLPLADSTRVKVGDTAVAIGNPFGLDRTATAGIVSGVGRHIRAPNGATIDQVVQTDAPINPGNSGGPLLDVKARVIGVNSQIETSGQTGNGNVGIGFAVPANTVQQVVPRLKRGQTIDRPYLGVVTARVAGRSGGAVVRSVRSGGPAARAGVQTGDVIVGVNGGRVNGPSDVSAGIQGQAPGDIVTIQVLRDGQPVTVDVELGRRGRQGP